ncbi:methyl-accepting chemotaxis protein [Rugamonas sp. CCM 8940]|uniref:methyl-accepting chemotaxis protein n=1 Tax=Rugamonas sp. CCM 8940 TaxID=2765359 RepID=UPI00351C3378
MGKNLTLKQLFAYLFGLAAAIGVCLLATLHQIAQKQDQLARVNETRYQSYLLADELRQSSDDLTRLARTYVVTADAAYEQQYLDILDIRNGRKPRPLQYQRIYWDFVAAGKAKPRADGASVALAELMKQAGFSEQEFAKLKEAQANSDALVKTEIVAMNAVKGQFDDGKGGFSRKDAPDLELARKLMHDKNYHQYKASIMAPIDEFFVLLDQRTRAGVDAAVAASERVFALALTLSMLLCGGLGVALLLVFLRLRRQLGGEPAYAAAVADRIAAGQLAFAIELRQDDRASLLFAMSTMRDRLAEIVGEVRASTDTIATAAGQIAAGNLDLSQRTEQQAGSLEQTASSMEQLTSTVKQNADNARQARQLAESATAVAQQGGSVVGQVVETMSSINDSSKQIADIIGVIDGIAFQTNILALNAAVEAARAGEQGRGFAVVASEVRNLAQRAAAAAKEIKDLIVDSVEKVGAGARLVDQAGATMQEIVASVQRVTDVMSEIAAASSEQTAGIEQINQAVNQMDQVTQQNAALVEQAAAAASSLQQQAGHLTGVVGVFKLEGGGRAAPVPAAAPHAALAPTPDRQAHRVAGKVAGKVTSKAGGHVGGGHVAGTAAERAEAARRSGASNAGGGAAKARRLALATAEEEWEEL